MTDGNHKTVKQKVLEFLLQNPTLWFTHTELRGRLNVKHNPQVFTACEDLAREGRIEREQRGRSWHVRYVGAEAPPGLFDWIPNRALREVVRADWDDAKKCLSSGAFKAAMVMGGACLEAVLIAALQTRDREVRPLLPEKFRGYDLSKLPLRELATVAQRLGYIKPRVGDFLIQSRNLIHPTVAAAEGPISRNEAEADLGLVEDCLIRVAAHFSRILS